MPHQLTTASAFEIRRPTANEEDLLFDIWWRSVRATHTFLSEPDLQSLAPLVRELRLVSLDTWLLCAASGPIGFIVMDDTRVEALFIHPEWLRRGGGSLLIDHARRLYGKLKVDVNEPNIPALRFYLARGFSIVGRSATDSAGRPFPLLHLSQTA